MTGLFIYYKCLAVINSCTTIHQLHAATKYLVLSGKLKTTDYLKTDSYLRNNNYFYKSFYYKLLLKSIYKQIEGITNETSI